MPQLRQNIITGEWVVIAPERSKRPDDYAKLQSKQIIVAKDQDRNCVFCPNQSEHKRRLKEYDTKNIWVIPNKFPAFVCDEKQCSTRSFYPEHSFFRAKSAVGEHDVIVIKDHKTDMTHFTVGIWNELLEVIQTRMIVHRRNQYVEHIMPIYNHKSEAGASVAHPHAQIFSGPVISNKINQELEGCQRYYNNNGICVFCDLVVHEKKEKLRLLEENEHFVAFTFYAARFPYEIWVISKKHQSTFESLTAKERKSLAQITSEVINRLSKLLANPPLNWWIHTLPTTQTDSHYYHWHLEIAPRITGYGGFEMGSGMVIDIQSPEEAAMYLNK